MSEADLAVAPDAPTGFPFEENHVRYRLGWTKDEMRGERKKRLVEGQDFCLHKKRVYLSAAAVRKLFAILGLPLKKAATAPPRTITDDGGAVKTVLTKKAAPAPEILRVVRCDLRNRHLLLACPVAENPDRAQTLLRVRVRKAENFVRRMEIPALRVAGYDDLYDLARALPRKKGKW